MSESEFLIRKLKVGTFIVSSFQKKSLYPDINEDDGHTILEAECVL